MANWIEKLYRASDWRTRWRSACGITEPAAKEKDILLSSPGGYRDIANIITDYSWYRFNFIEDIDNRERLKNYTDYITNFQLAGLPGVVEGKPTQTNSAASRDPAPRGFTESC